MFDQTAIEVDASISLAISLIELGHQPLARSPKFHRPRGPYCLRGNCDGCLVRVNGVPNVMSCMYKPNEGDNVERQNYILSPQLDLLRINDWFFPKGMNHHELMAGVPGLQQVMQSFAHRVSGLGELPESSSQRTYTTEEHSVDVLIVGAGSAGLCVAKELATSQLSCLVVDQQNAPGGSLLSFPKSSCWNSMNIDEFLNKTLEFLQKTQIKILCNTKVLGVYEGKDWVLDQHGSILLNVHPKLCILATGSHDFVPTFENNDLPGIVSARAAGRMLRDGVLVGEKPIVIGEGPYTEAFLRAAEYEHAKAMHVPSTASLIKAHGLSHVQAATVTTEDQKQHRIRCDAIVVEGPNAPSFELAGQLGATLASIRSTYGYAVCVDETLKTDAKGSCTYAIGEVTGNSFNPIRFAKQANTLAHTIEHHFAKLTS